MAVVNVITVCIAIAIIRVKVNVPCIYSLGKLARILIEGWEPSHQTVIGKFFIDLTE